MLQDRAADLQPICRLWTMLLLGCTLLVACGTLANENNLGQELIKLSEQNSGYNGSVQGWVDFLRCWSNATENDQKRSRLLVRDWLSTDDATSIKVDGEEQSVSKSISDFFLAIRQIETNEPEILDSIPLIRKVVPTGLALYRLADAEDWALWRESVPTAVSDEMYYRYGFTPVAEKKQDPAFLRHADLDHLLYVADFHHLGRLLVNTNERTSDGEWEAWNLSWRLPGAVRYRSFAELVKAVYVEHAVPGVNTVGPYSDEVLGGSCARHLEQ